MAHSARLPGGRLELFPVLENREKFRLFFAGARAVTRSNNHLADHGHNRSSRSILGFDDNLQRLRFSRMAEYFVGVEDLV